jgi:hypothetical protein
MLSLSRQVHDKYSPFHQRTLCLPVGHQPMLGGGLFFIVPTIAVKALLLVQGKQFDCLDLVGAQEAQNVGVLDVGGNQAHGAWVIGVIAMAKALGLVVQVTDQGLVYVVYVVNELYAVQRAGWGAVHDKARKRKVAPASPRAMAKRVSKIMGAP